MKLFKLIIFLYLIIGLNCNPMRNLDKDPESKEFYSKARFIMTKEEKEIFLRLPDSESRKQFIKEFWEKRDPDPSTEENEAKTEFYRRIEFANHYFKEGSGPGWKTDRGRIYLLLGPPDKRIQQPFLDYPNLKARIIWVYYRYKLAIEFVDSRGTGEFRINNYPVELLTALEREKLIFDIKKRENKPVNFKIEYDPSKKEVIIKLPTNAIFYKEENGYFTCELKFNFFVYKKNGLKVSKFTKERNFKELKEKVMKLDYIIFSFPLKLKRGEYFLDVLVEDREGIIKFRRIEKIKI